MHRNCVKRNALFWIYTYICVWGREVSLYFLVLHTVGRLCAMRWKKKKNGDNPRTSLPTAYCICSSDYIHKVWNKTTAYGTADCLKPAIWGPSIIPVSHSPLRMEASAKPYHHFSHLNSATDTAAGDRRRCHKTFYWFFFFASCRHTLISPNNGAAPVFKCGFCGRCHSFFFVFFYLTPPPFSPICRKRFQWRYLSRTAWLILLHLVRLQHRKGLFDMHNRAVAGFDVALETLDVYS